MQNNIITTEHTELIKPENLQKVDIQSYLDVGNVDELTAIIEKEALSLVVDSTTEAGRKELKSLSYSVARCKTTIDKVGKDMTAEWKKKTDIINGHRKKAFTTLEALQKKILQPVTDYEEAEQKRLDGQREIIARMRTMVANIEQQPAEVIGKRMEEISALHIDTDWDETIQVMADAALQECMQKMEFSLKQAKEKAINDAELAKLRAESEAKDAELEKLRAAEAERQKETQAPENPAIGPIQKQNVPYLNETEMETNDRYMAVDMHQVEISESGEITIHQDDLLIINETMLEA